MLNSKVKDYLFYIYNEQRHSKTSEAPTEDSDPPWASSQSDQTLGDPHGASFDP